MAHIEYRISALPSEQEILMAQLSDVGAIGFEEMEDHLLAYFDEEADASAIETLIGAAPFSKTILEEQNWNAVWESNFEPIIIPGICAVRAHFHAAITDVPHEIVITPKMSFGTGHHPTTYLMLQEMNSLNFGGKKVFDFGTGTGVLAIFAELLGAEEVVAIDVDDWSISNTQENVERNNCHRISVSLSSQLPKDEFDIVLANINRNVLLNYLEGLSRLVKKEGLLLLSGLLIADAAIIQQEAERHGFGFKKVVEKHGWISMVFTHSI